MRLTRDQMARMSELLDQALDLDVQARIDWLRTASPEDSELAAALRAALLPAADEIDKLSTLPRVVAPAEAQESGPSGLTPGTRVGPYALMRILGAGGMAEVWLARRADGAFKRDVALKLPLQSFRRELLALRFARERDILAVLEHPNIARLYDAGVDAAGLPYLAMEFVDGLPIHEYCEQHARGIEAQLRLLIDVCAAVQYAHQRLVIHRDIKPSNILVTSAGVPKLLDFGIAKLLEATAAAASATETAAVVRLFTPAYASPEQVHGKLVTTATDVYSLGVVLFKLLGGVPQDITSGSGARFALNTGALTRRQAADLTSIVRMATHEDPARRYASVEQLAADLKRHLGQLPIVARRDTLSYRASMFIRRHAAAVALASAAVVTLLIAMGTTLYEARIAQQERARSERRFNDARRLANSLMTEIYGSIKDLPGATPARRLLVSKALQYLDGLSHDALGDAALESELATAYALVGDVQGNPYYPNLGDPRGALESYRKALAIRERLAAAAPGDSLAVRRLSGSYNQIGAALTGLGDFGGALQSFRSAVGLLEPVSANSTDPTILDQFAGSYFYLAGAAQRTGDLDLAADSIRHATAIRDRIETTDPKRAREILTHRAGDHARAAAILEMKHMTQEAVAEQTRATVILWALAKQDPDNATTRSFLGKGYQSLGILQEESGLLAEAEQSFLSATQADEKVLGADPKNAFARLDLANEYKHLGTLQVGQGRLQPGLASLNQALAVIGPLADADPSNSDLRASFADLYSALASATEAHARTMRDPQQSHGEMQRACDWYRRSEAEWLDLSRQHLLDASDLSRPQVAAEARAACETERDRRG